VPPTRFTFASLPFSVARITIAKLEFPGAKAISQAKLRATLNGKEANVNRVGGTFDEAALAFDEIFLQVELWNRGFAEAKIGKPRVVRRGRKIELAIPIEEGPRYRIGRVEAPLAVSLRPGAVFTRTEIVAAMTYLQEQLGTTVFPATHLDPATQRIDVTFQVDWRYPWDPLRFWLSRSR
jgi:outer membrane protein assembly factor BamA